MGHAPEPSPLPVPAPPDLVVREVPGDPDRLEVEVVETAGSRSAWTRPGSAWPSRDPACSPGAQHRRVREQVASAQALLWPRQADFDVGRVAAPAPPTASGPISVTDPPPMRRSPAPRSPKRSACTSRPWSRAVAGKRLRLPDGRVIALAELFGVAQSAQDSLQAWRPRLGPRPTAS